MEGPIISGGNYAITADSGEFGLKAKLLLESIKQWDSKATIFLFIPSNSVNELDDNRYRFFENNANVIIDEFPIPEYPPSALQKSFVKASQKVSNGPVIALDTDTVLTAPITLPSSSADAYMRPAGFAGRYWGSEQSHTDWKTLFDHFDVDFPTKTVYSFCDRKPFYVPFYNAGVVVSNDLTFAKEWLRITEELFYNTPLSLENEFFIDQIALTILSQRYSIQKLSERQNFQARCRFNCPDKVEIIHYHNFVILNQISNPTIKEKLSHLETFRKIPKGYELSRLVRLYANRLFVHGSRVIPYPYNVRLSRAVQRAWECVMNRP